MRVRGTPLCSNLLLRWELPSPQDFRFAITGLGPLQARC